MISKYLRFFLVLFVISVNSNIGYCLNRLKEGQKLETFSLKTLNGDSLDINKYSKGKNVAIIFWEIPEVENYIDYSKEALKTLVKMQNEYKNKDLEILRFIARMEMRQYLKRKKMELVN